jgi:Cu(I)/Ag(I) efflux system membrane fusion protein/cobalt-zinc-cadmium efflux system membrane fusion protein
MKFQIRNALHAARWAATVLVLTVVGVGLGIGARTVLVPLLPMKVRMQLGDHHAMQPSGGAQAGREVAFWKSSMIPNFVSPHSGVDPMGMELIPVYRDELSAEKYITLSSAVAQNVGLRTQPVVRAEAEQSVRTVGQVEYAERLLGDVTLKVDGWVEELLADFVGQQVERGQPLFRLYSPELVTAQQEYLITLQGRAAPAERLAITIPGVDTVLSAHDKLRYWDVPESEIQDIQRAGRTKKESRLSRRFRAR